MLKETEFGDKSRRYYLTRTEEYVDGLKAALGIWCAARASQKGLSFSRARCWWLAAKARLCVFVPRQAAHPKQKD